MTLVTRVSVAFLVALALALGGFSACLYYVAGLRLRLALDQELETTLDHFPDRREDESGRVTWAIYDEAGRRIESAPGTGRPMVLDGRDLGPLAVDLATTIVGPDGLRWRVLARGGRTQSRRAARGPGQGASPGAAGAGGAQGRRAGPRAPGRVLAAWASLEPVEAEIRSLAAVLPLIALGLWALTAAVGRHFARRALAPLTLMAESARTMPFDDGRLPGPGTRDELEDFARSFNGLLDRLHVALERQRQFTGQASHQLRTPLAALIAAIEVARRRPRTVAEHERVLDRLRDDAVRLWRVVEALLFLARADAEAGLPDLECLDLATWAADHLRAWSEHERAADLRFEGGDGDPPWTRRIGRCSASCWTTCWRTPSSTADRTRRSSSAPGASPAPSRWRSRTAASASRPRISRGSSSRSIAPSRPAGSAARGLGWAWPSPVASPRRTAARSPRRASRTGAAASWSACRGRRRRTSPRRSSMAPRRSPRPWPEQSVAPFGSDRFGP